VDEKRKVLLKLSLNIVNGRLEEDGNQKNSMWQNAFPPTLTEIEIKSVVGIGQQMEKTLLTCGVVLYLHTHVFGKFEVGKSCPKGFN
jgi:hypothetical protein